MADLLYCVDTLLSKVDDLAARAFFLDDFAAYPNNENCLKAEVLAQLGGDDYGADESDDEYKSTKELIALAEGITFSSVDSYGGEDCGRDYWSIWEFKRGDEVVVFKFQGWYASHYGSEYEEYFQVKAVEKTITVWE